MPDFAFHLLESDRWSDYALLDSGEGWKLERFGKHIFARPESQAMWRRAAPTTEWGSADAVFQPTGEESGGHWSVKRRIEEKWKMQYPLPLIKGRRAFDLHFW